MKPRLLVILGPTATGKSDLAVKLAKKLKGEIISADSRQVYKGLDIGTGKINKKEMRGVPHHLLDVADPRKQFSVAKFQELGQKTINEILKRKKVPILVGGTGFYIEALVDGMILPEVKPDLQLRKRLNKKTAAQLLSQLKKLDPVRAENIDPKNSRRIIRAIEIATALGKVPKIKKVEGKYKPTFIGLNFPAQELRERIHRRLIKRIKQGMITEAKRLHSQGLSWKRMNELGLEYKYLALHLQGKLTKEEMIEKLSTEIWRYAKRQITWFKRDKRIKWFNPSSSALNTFSL